MDQQIGSDGNAGGGGGGHMTVVQAIPSSGNQVQVVQAGQVIQSANGQQIVVHAVPQNAGQPVHLGSQGNQQLQLLQLPVQVICVFPLISTCCTPLTLNYYPFIMLCPFDSSHKRNLFKRLTVKRSYTNPFKWTTLKPLLSSNKHNPLVCFTSCSDICD